MNNSLRVLKKIKRSLPSPSFYDSVLNITINSPKVISLQCLRAVAVLGIVLIATEVAVVKNALAATYDVTDIMSVQNNSIYND